MFHLMINFTITIKKEQTVSVVTCNGTLSQTEFFFLDSVPDTEGKRNRKERFASVGW